jgi:hypothetical protein
MRGSVSDPRGSKGRQYPVEYVLAVCVVAMLAGAKSYAEIARHAADMPQPLLRNLGAKLDWFKLRYAWPGMSLIWNVLTRVDAAELDRITGTWIAARARKGRKGEWILALDGKVIRGAWTSENDKVTMFSALLHDEAVTIAQVRVPDITNEITQVEERGRGRIKKWSCWRTGADGIDFPHVSQVACIRRETFEISGDRISKEYALILTSRNAEKMTAADINRHTSNHWRIENKSHYIRSPGAPGSAA